MAPNQIPSHLFAWTPSEGPIYLGLGVDSPFFSAVVLFKNQAFSQFFV